MCCNSIYICRPRDVLYVHTMCNRAAPSDVCRWGMACLVVLDTNSNQHAAYQTEKFFLCLVQFQSVVLFFWKIKNQTKRNETFLTFNCILYWLFFSLITVIFNEIHVLDIIIFVSFCCLFELVTFQNGGAHRCHSLPIIIFAYSFLHLNPIWLFFLFRCGQQHQIVSVRSKHEFYSI